MYWRLGDALGEAGCIFGLGTIALSRSEYGEAQQKCQEALPLFHHAGHLNGEANCIRGLGDIAQEDLDHAKARQQYETALGIYGRIEDLYSIGTTHRRLARIAATPDDRACHLQAAREAWLKIDRPDLVRELDDEFGFPPKASRARTS